MDTMSSQTSADFAQCVEWAADQSWSSGKVGLLGISYYAGSQWRVAARRPKGLACIVPWEGMTDYYRDRVRHGGILSAGFVDFWWNRQVVTNQYGRPGRSKSDWGPDTIEGDLPDDELKANRQDQTIDIRKYKYLDEHYYAEKDYALADIEVPVLSVANWGGILLHLRGNVVGYIEAGTKNKWLWFITGRHDIPFYLPEYVKLQKSFLDAWLKGKDDRGWLKGPNVSVPAVNVLLREGNPGFNSTEAERTFIRREEAEWPIARTLYTKYHLQPNQLLTNVSPNAEAIIEYDGLTGEPVQFSTPAFTTKTEITGHVLAKLAMSVGKKDTCPKDLDVFVTLRLMDKDGKEVFYTGTAGDPVPIVKGFQRASVRAINSDDNRHHDWLPRRDFSSKDVAYLKQDEIIELIIEIWPTSVVVSPGQTLIFEVSPKDTQGAGIFLHNEPSDRSDEIFGGKNRIHIGPDYENWLQLPIIP